MTPNQLPSDSILQSWCSYLSVSEIPLTYQIAAGLSTIGACLRRTRFIDQVEWKVFTNQSVLFIGPSGIGKDTIINRVQGTIDSLAWLSHVPVIGGKTFEAVCDKLANLGRPAAAYIPAGEMADFFGRSDYQANMLTGVTNLLSTGLKVDISTKGWQSSHGGEARVIYEPTVVMHAGSTADWLHRQMPDGTLEGGFLGRFLIIAEELSPRHVALVKSALGKEELERVRGALTRWQTGLEEIIRRARAPREMILTEEAEHLYTNWYHNRFRLFSRAVMPYANRSRDMVLRLAMLMGLSRGHDRWVDAEDMGFAISLLAEVARKIDRVILPASKEAQCAAKVLELLPCSLGEIYKQLATRYSIKYELEPALELLRRTDQIVTEGGITKKNETA